MVWWLLIFCYFVITAYLGYKAAGYVVGNLFLENRESYDGGSSAMLEEDENFAGISSSQSGADGITATTGADEDVDDWRYRNLSSSEAVDELESVLFLSLFRLCSLFLQRIYFTSGITTAMVKTPLAATIIIVTSTMINKTQLSDVFIFALSFYTVLLPHYGFFHYQLCQWFFYRGIFFWNNSGKFWQTRDVTLHWTSLECCVARLHGRPNTTAVLPNNLLAELN